MVPTWNKERELASGFWCYYPNTRSGASLQKPKYHQCIPLSGGWKNRGPQKLRVRYHSYIEVDHVGRGGVFNPGKICWYEWRSAWSDEGLKRQIRKYAMKSRAGFVVVLEKPGKLFFRQNNAYSNTNNGIQRIVRLHLPNNLQDLPPDMVIRLSQKLTNPIRFTGLTCVRLLPSFQPSFQGGESSRLALVVVRADKLMASEVIATKIAFSAVSSMASLSWAHYSGPSSFFRLFLWPRVLL